MFVLTYLEKHGALLPPLGFLLLIGGETLYIVRSRFRKATTLSSARHHMGCKEKGLPRGGLRGHRGPGALLWLFFLLVFFLGGPGTASGLTKSEENTIKVFRQVAPGVVNITTTAIAYDFFFNPYPAEGSGSGFIVTDDGYIVTSFHVVRDQTRLEVTLADGSKWPAHVAGTAPESDVAVIKIEAPREALQPLRLGSSEDLRVGQKVLAVGNPFGLGHTLTAGTVSSVGRDVDIGRDVVIRGAIQTNAAINPGNSGGPLIDSDGKVVGVNTAIFSPTGANVGISFAIPAATVRHLLPGLVSPWPRVISWILAALLVGWFLWWLRRRL
jgi:S1-C subfamily serine protease